MTFAEAPDVLTVEEVAELMRCGVKQVYRAVKSGSLYGVRLGSRIRVPKAALVRWLEGDAEAPEPRLSIMEGGHHHGRPPRAV